MKKQPSNGAMTFARLVAVTILLLTLIAGSLISAWNTQLILRDNREKDTRVEAAVIESAISNSFLRPVTVSETMAKDDQLRQSLRQSGDNPVGVEDTISGYLSSIRKGFGYTMAFTVCDRSRAYYTPDGISAYIDPSYTGSSEWYGVFKASGKDFDLDVDTEISADWALSVFINRAIRDDDNTLLGVCGVAVEMSNLQSLLKRYERIYNVKIDLVDETGLIQVDTDGPRIERDYLSLPDITTISDGEYYYELLSDSARVITYMQDLDWYLVVEDRQTKLSSVMSFMKPSLICSAIGIALAILAYLILRRKRSPVE